MADESKGFDVTKVLRDLRDAGMDAWAKMMLRLTYSHEYQRLQGMIAKPTLLGIALWRKASENAMSGVLSQLNMPSREDVLHLSQRLTHIEMTLDDLGAAMEQVRKMAGAQRPQRASSASASRGDSGGESARAPISAKEA
jgi:hypothetical protein